MVGLVIRDIDLDFFLIVERGRLQTRQCFVSVRRLHRKQLRVGTLMIIRGLRIAWGGGACKDGERRDWTWDTFEHTEPCQ